MTYNVRRYQINMKFFFAALVAFFLSAGAWSITCYRCGGAAPSGACSSTNTATVKCDDETKPNVVFACQVYTVNYTSLNKVLDFKSCCLYEDCNKDPCKEFGQSTICFNMASCQSDRCNYNYTTAMGGPRPTMPSKGTICSKMASYQSDRCNFNYTTALAGPRPTIHSKADIVSFYGHPVAALIIFAMFFLPM